MRRIFLFFLLVCFGQSIPTKSNIRELIPLEAPRQLTLINLEGKEAMLKWQPVEPESVRGTFRGYIVRIWNHGLSQVYAIPPEVTETAVQFFPYSKNFITVAVRNDKFVGPRSDTLSFDAPQTEPSPPHLFDWYALGGNAVLLQWTKPRNHNGILLGYNIYVSEIKDIYSNERSTVHYHVDGPDNLQTKISQLKNGTRYQIDLAATNCAGESDYITVEVELESHEPQPPSIPYFEYKIDPKEFNPKEECKKPHTPYIYEEPSKAFDIEDDYFIFNDSDAGRIVKVEAPISVTEPPENPCSVKCIITWVPDIDNNPGDSFYVKYRPRGEKEFIKTDLETKNDKITLEEFDGCRRNEIIVVARDGEFETESDVQVTPAVIYVSQFSRILN